MVQVAKREKDPTTLESVFTMKPTPRVERMREAFLGFERSVSIVRARIEARVMRETDGQPMILRRAKAFAAAMREMPLDIQPDELVVGSTSVGPRCANIVPGTQVAAQERAASSVGYAQRAILPGLSDDDLRELEEDLTPYWKQQGRVGRVATWHYGHNIHGMEKVVKRGFLGIKADAEERISRLDMTDPADIKKRPFLEGVVIAMEAASELGERYAAETRRLAEAETDATRKAELLKIAEICDWVPANPARTFREALQSFHFAWLMLTVELYHNIAFALGRMDQYLYPYYERDIREGRITKEEAQELLDCYILKLNYVGNGGQSSSGSLGVGGVKADGNDATNELSFMFIESMMHTRLADPWFAVHVHSKTPDDFLIRAAELCSIGSSHPQFLNSDVGIAQELARGSMGGPMVTLEDARNASNVGCLELVIPGKDSGYLYVGGHNLASAVELALTNGVRRSDGEKVGAETGDARQFSSFEEVREACRQQIVHMREDSQVSGIIFEQSLIELYPTVYESALIDDCIEKGLCREEGGAHYNFNTGGTEVGSSDAGDSLAAIKKLVFDEKKVTMAQLLDALDANFEGHDEIRRMCSEVAKFGNDDDYADEQKAWIIHQWAVEFIKLTNLRGGHGCPGGSSMAGYIPGGKIVGALPSGRLAGEPLAPAASPSTGKDVNGVTAVLKSMGKVDGVEILAGLSLTSRVDPAVFKSRDGMKRMADMIRTFVDQKIFHLQLNVVSSDALRAAQEEPEKHRDLMVKVAGYNAYFTQLSKPLQESIIARTEHGL
ncbi:MAG: pyruvate formate lyase family protein [Dehalococcoidia bacterium]